jgi:hypothetical protein
MWVIYRIEQDGSETIIGTANDVGEAALVIDNDKDNIDYDAGYHWKKE